VCHADCQEPPAPVDLDELRDRSRRDLAWAVWLRLCEHVITGGTAEGSARVVQDELRRQQVPDAGRWVTAPPVAEPSQPAGRAGSGPGPASRRRMIAAIGAAVGLQEVCGL
jgi:hypothetical protein